jgi:beta-barrel assembly-enhancing protease
MLTGACGFEQRGVSGDALVLMRARSLAKCLLACLLLLQAACGGPSAIERRGAQTTPRFNAGFNLFSPEQDVELGKASAEEIERQTPVLNDERTARYVQKLGERIAANAPGYRFKYKFIVVASPEVNAFALPGGYIFINEGAIAASRSEGELAAVLAHEISHVELRHGTTQASKTYLVKVGLNILEAATGGRACEFGRRVNDSARAAAGTLFTRFNRAAEIQADIEGARLMAAAGYDPRDMAAFFETLGERGGEHAQETPNDHPETASRVAAILDAIPTLVVSPSPVRDTEEFRRIKSRLDDAQ